MTDDEHDQLNKNAYQSIRRQLEKDSPGQWALLNNGELKGVFKRRAEAFESGNRLNCRYWVQEIADWDDAGAFMVL